jgi:predicted metal-dependent TIM-barrel fold hydrolase
VRAALTTKLVGLATDRLDVTDPAVRDHIQRLLAAQQEVERALAVLAQDLAAVGVAPEDIEADLEARVAELRDLQGAVLMATAAKQPDDDAA